MEEEWREVEKAMEGERYLEFGDKKHARVFESLKEHREVRACKYTDSLGLLVFSGGMERIRAWKVLGFLSLWRNKKGNKNMKRR